jgi:hypothetical protein
VLIPALNLAEQDRHRNALDDSTVVFITQTTKDLVEEFSLRVDHPGSVGSSGHQGPLATLGTIPGIADAGSKKIACLPVRDDADEVVGIMLAQLLDRAGYSAMAIPIGSVDGMLAEAANAEPEIVCLSALPPYAVSHARSIYRRLRREHPKLKIIIGLWNYQEDPVKAAMEISGREQNLVCTTLAQIILQASLAVDTPRIPRATLPQPLASAGATGAV